MGGDVFVSGLTSGFDWAGMVDQIMDVESQSVRNLESRKAQYEKKLTNWRDFNNINLVTLKDYAEDLADEDTFNVFKSSLASSSDTESGDLLSVTTGSTASPGSYDIVINQKAKKLISQSKAFSDTSTALGYNGDFMLNGVVIDVDADDTLDDIKNKINSSNTGTNPSGVSASIISISDTDNRLVLTSGTEGEDGFNALEADSSDILQSLGLNDGTKSINRATSDGAESNRFSSSTIPVGSLLGLESPPSSTSITIGDESSISINLNTMSLTDIKTAIDAAAPTGVTVTVASETVDNTTTYYLDIDGTVQFGDGNNVLEALGILKGGRGSAAEVHTGSVANAASSSAITSSTQWNQIDGTTIAVGETITISGIDHNGNTVSGTYTVNNLTDSVQTLLTEIETAYSGGVTASVTAEGKIQIQDDTSGASQLSLTLVANNEQGGGLDFGTVSATTEGYDMELQAGQDAQLTVNGISVTRSDNQIDDLITGLTLNLVKADPLITITLDVERDLASIKASVQHFLDGYNDVISFINIQNTYDEDAESGGVLMGDSTLSSLQQSLQSIVFNQVNGLPSGWDSLFLIGISSNSSGRLILDETEFFDALRDDFNAVANIFIASGETTDNDVEYVAHTTNTQAGTYDIDITAAATQAAVTGSTDLSGGISGTENITIIDTLTGRSATITLTNGEDTATIVSNLNQEFATEYSQVLTGSVANTTDGSTPITSSTTWANVYNAGVADGDTMKVQGTNRNGQTVYNYYTIDDASTDTISGLLSTIESLFQNKVTAYIDASGYLVVSENDVGDSQFTMSIINNNEGGGSLDFGAMNETVTGRYAMAITASDSGGYLKLVHDDYGTANGLTVSQTADYTGITDTEYVGIDVAGTINGESATGKGKVLTADSGVINVDGLAIKVTLTAAELSSQGSAQGSLTLTMGVAEQVNRLLDIITDEVEGGLVSNRIDFLGDTIDDIDEQIEDMNRRLNSKRARLMKQYIAVESIMAQMQTMSTWFNQQLASLSSL